MYSLTNQEITLNWKYLRPYLLAIGAVCVAGLGFILIDGRDKYLYAILAFSAVFAVLVHPRLAVYQFVFFIFTNMLFSVRPVVLMIDISAFLLIASAFADYLLKGKSPYRISTLVWNYALILGALSLAAIFGYKPLTGVAPMIRVVVLMLTFLSLVRLLRYVELRAMLKLYFWLAVMHAMIALAPYIGAATVERAYGFARSTLDDLMMLALPIGVTLYLWSGRNRGTLYLIGFVITLISLLATQSRLSIVFSLLLVVIAGVLSLKFGRNIERPLIRKRLWLMAATATLGIFLLISISPDIIAAVIGRFEHLLTYTPGGTYRIRLVLWETALNAFWDHPVLGIGPGLFRTVYDIYPELHFNFVYAYVRGISAHNPVLHYLAETGIVGTVAVIALFVRQFKFGRLVWKERDAFTNPETPLLLSLFSGLFFFTIFIEAGWMWGQISFLFVFFLAMITRAYESSQAAQ